MSRDYDPEEGQWYTDLEREELFLVLSVDPDLELVRLQWLEGDVVEIFLDEWSELDLELAEQPEGWVAVEDFQAADWDEEEADEDEEDDEWDDDYDEYHDRQ